MTPLIVKNLNKTFVSGFWPFTATKEFNAVKNISFELNKGEILGFLGPNGAGKTTTIQMLLGTLTPSSGEISYFSDNFLFNRTKCLAKIGYASGYERLPHRLSVYENLDIVARIYGLSANTRKQQIELLLKSFDIWDKRDAETGSLSAGQSTRVMLAKAFIARPEIILLDEPTASLDPDIAIEVRKFILEYQKNNQSSFLIASHNMDEVAELCGRILVLKNGEIIANNSPAELVKTISQTHVHLHITENLSAALEQLKQSRIIHSNSGAQISITIDEHQIAQLLSQLANIGANYSSISIDKPSLEDYFLSLTKKD